MFRAANRSSSGALTALTDARDYLFNNNRHDT